MFRRSKLNFMLIRPVDITPGMNETIPTTVTEVIESPRRSTPPLRCMRFVETRLGSRMNYAAVVVGSYMPAAQ